MPWLLTRNRGRILPAQESRANADEEDSQKHGKEVSMLSSNRSGVARTANIVGVSLACVSQLPKPEMATPLADCCRKERKDSGCNRNNQEESSVDVRTRSMVVNPYCRAYSVYILWRGVGFSLGI
jgi:hypothetical protein